MYIKLKIPVSDTDYDDNHFDFNSDIDEYTLRLKLRQYKKDVNYKFHYETVSAYIWGADKEEIDINKLFDIRNKQNKCILIISINPETVNGDLSGELKSWIRESNLVWDMSTGSDIDKVKVLPSMDFIIDDENGNIMKLINSKLINDYSNKKSKYYFAIIIDKIV